MLVGSLVAHHFLLRDLEPCVIIFMNERVVITGAMVCYYLLLRDFGFIGQSW
jgi:hypothetical protein